MWAVCAQGTTGPSACTGATSGTVVGAGAPPMRHRGQEMPATALLVTVPSPSISTLCMPRPEQITNSLCGWMTGAAIAAASVNANHSRVRRESQGEERRAWKNGMNRHSLHKRCAGTDRHQLNTSEGIVFPQIGWQFQTQAAPCRPARPSLLPWRWRCAYRITSASAARSPTLSPRPAGTISRPLVRAGSLPCMKSFRRGSR